MTSTTTSTDATKSEPEQPRRFRSRRRSPSARMRILGWYVVLLAVALAAALLLQRAFLLARLSTDADDALDQEVGELRQLATGTNPETGEPFGGDLRAIFDTFLSRNVPLTGEVIMTIVDGELYSTDAGGAALASSGLVDLWTDLVTTARGEIETDDGPLRYLAVPLLVEGDPSGVFVVAVHMAGRISDVNEIIRLGAVVYGSVFLLASAFAWIAAGGVLRPIRDLADTARSIGGSDWSRRIPVDGRDEIAELGNTFNSMLDRLEESFATQRRFVDDAGHELRTPITIIRGNLELMGDDPAERAETMELVTDELDRMARIVDDLLVIAKAQQPDFIETHPVDLGELTRDLVERAEALDRREWRLDHVDDVVFEADRQRLMQAVMNLLGNAVEHTPSGTPVSIGARDDVDAVRIWVRDEGPGIEPEETARIFDRFARGGSGQRSTAGAGLGLAIVRAIAEGHGGRIEVSSTPGRGATFTMVFPKGFDEVSEA